MTELTKIQEKILSAVRDAGGTESTETLYDLVYEEAPGDEEDPFENCRAEIGALEREGLLEDQPSNAVMGALRLTDKARGR